MSFPRMTADTGVISELPDRPNVQVPMTSAQLKASFDQASTAVKTYLNSALLPALEASGVSGAAEQIGIKAITELAGAATVQAALEALVAALAGVQAGTVLDNSITNDKLCHTAGSEAVNSNVIRNLAVTAAKLNTGAVTTDKLADGAVGTGKIADASVTGAKIAAGAVGTQQLASGAVNTGKLEDGAVSGPKLANGAVTPEKCSGMQAKHVLDQNYLYPGSWSNKRQTINFNGVSDSNTLIVLPHGSSCKAWNDNNVRWISQQANGTVTFECDTVPAETITVRVVVLAL